jgi:hypothetical protein
MLDEDEATQHSNAYIFGWLVSKEKECRRQMNGWMGES